MEKHSKVMEDFKNKYCSALGTPQQQGAPVREGKRCKDDPDQYEKMPDPKKRAKLESGSGDPGAAYMKALGKGKAKATKAKASLNWPLPASFHLSQDWLPTPSLVGPQPFDH